MGRENGSPQTFHTNILILHDSYYSQATGHLNNETQQYHSKDSISASLMALCETLWKKYDFNYNHCYTMFESTNLARTQVTLNR